MLIVSLLMVFPLYSNQIQVKLAWTYNPISNNIIEYRLYDITSSKTLKVATPFNTVTISTYIGATYVVTAYNGLESGFSNSVTVDPPISPYNYNIIQTSSSLKGYESIFAIDGKVNTFWSTDMTNINSNYPYTLIIDMMTKKIVKGWSYLPRQDTSTNLNHLGKYQIHISNDLINWTILFRGEFTTYNNSEKIVFNKKLKKSGRYFRLTALSEIKGSKDLHIAELKPLF
jgi:hypothetical protein